MRPVLFSFAMLGRTFTAGAYSTMYALAWLLAPVAAALVARARGLAWKRVLAVYSIALALGIAGARALDLFVAADFYAEEPSRILAFSFQGFSLYGGLVLATLTGIALARLLRLPVWQLADCSVAGLLVGEVLMRTGCWLKGCCFGLPTDLPWGVTYPAGSPAWAQQLLEGRTGIVGFLGAMEPVHPTQFYEMAGSLAAGALAWWLARKNTPDGVPFLAYALGFTFVRLGNHLVRARQPVITAPDWFYPASYLALAAVLTALIVVRLNSRATSAGSPPTSS